MTFNRLILTVQLPTIVAITLIACSGPEAVGADPLISQAERDRVQANTPLPQQVSAAQLRSNTVVFKVEVPIEYMVSWYGSVPLEDIVERSGDVPNVIGTELLSTTWSGAGSRRRVLMEGGDTALEEILNDDLPASFRYIVWNYTADAASYVEYGQGEFSMMAIDTNSTEVRWEYAFKPQGVLGRLFLGRWVNTTWSAWMNEVADAMAQRAEADYQASLVD